MFIPHNTAIELTSGLSLLFDAMKSASYKIVGRVYTLRPTRKVTRSYGHRSEPELWGTSCVAAWRSGSVVGLDQRG